MTNLVIVILKMSKNIEPPSFISENKSFDTYKKDLERWAVLTTLPADKQALLVVHYLDGDPSGIKEKIDEAIEEDTLRSANGIKALIEFFEKIYKKDAVDTAYEAFEKFVYFKRPEEMKMKEYVVEFEKRQSKATKHGCELSSGISAFFLLNQAQLSEEKKNLIKATIGI